VNESAIGEEQSAWRRRWRE